MLYYKDPLDAAYMVKHYYVNIIRVSTISMIKKYGQFYTARQLASHITNPNNRKDRYVVHPSSYDVFISQPHDIALDNADRVCKYTFRRWVVLDAPRHECEPVYPITTISRGQGKDLKRFIHPTHNPEPVQTD